MAPLENGGFQPSVWAGDRSRPIDSLMRALLYVAQQVGRPVSEADVRRLAAVPAAGLDEAAFLTAGAAARPRDPGPRSHARPARRRCRCRSSCWRRDMPAHVVVAGKAGQWIVLDVVDGRVWHLTADEVMALGARALVMREKLPERAAQRMVRAAVDARAAGHPEARRGLVRHQRARPRHAALHDADAEHGGRPRSPGQRRLAHDAAVRRHADRLRPRLRAAPGARLAVGAHRRPARRADERRGAASPDAASLSALRAHAVGRHRRAAAPARRAAQLLHRPDAGAGDRHRLRGAVPRRHLRHQPACWAPSRRWPSRC